MILEKPIGIESSGIRLAGLIAEPAKKPAPGVVLFHGLSNTKRDCSLLEETTHKLADNGFFTLRFDYFGSGESPGLLRDKTWDTLTQNSIDAAEFLASWPGVSSIGLWGRSLGGTLIALVAESLNARTLVIASAGLLVTRTLNREVFGHLKRKHEALAREGGSLPGTGKYKGPLELSDKFFEALPKVEKIVLEALPNLSNVLVLGTSPDVKVPLESFAIVINSVNEPKRLWIYEGVDHDFAGVEEQAIEESISWFRKHLMLT